MLPQGLRVWVFYWKKILGWSCWNVAGSQRFLLFGKHIVNHFEEKEEMEDPSWLPVESLINAHENTVSTDVGRAGRGQPARAAFPRSRQAGARSRVGRLASNRDGCPGAGTTSSHVEMLSGALPDPTASTLPAGSAQPSPHTSPSSPCWTPFCPIPVVVSLKSRVTRKPTESRSLGDGQPPRRQASPGHWPVTAGVTLAVFSSP